MTIEITQLPTPMQRSQPSTFKQRVADYFDALPDFVSELESQRVENNFINAAIQQLRDSGNNQLQNATNSANAANASAVTAAGANSIPLWVSGTTYAIGNQRKSPIDLLIYERKTAGAGTTDPSLDAVNWELAFCNFDTGYPDTAPTLNLDPVNSGVVDSRIVTTRSSPATYWDEFGVLRTAPANTLRIDHDPLTGERLGYLVEGAATNLIARSDNFESTYWVKAACTVSGSTYTETGSTGVIRSSTITVPAGSTVCGFFDISRNNTDWIIIYLSGTVSGSNSARVWFNLATGQKGGSFVAGSGVSLIDYNIENLGKGVYRCSVSASFVADQAFFLIHTATANGSASRADIGSGAGVGSAINLFRSQLETGVTRPTSYIKTKGSAVTRSADSPTIGGTDFTDFYNQSEGTFVVEAKADSYGVSASLAIEVNDGTDENRHLIGQNAVSNSALVHGFTRRNGETQAILLVNGQGVGVNRVSCYSYKDNQFLGVSSNLPVLSDSLGIVPKNMVQMRIGHLQGGTQSFNGHIRRIAYYPRASTQSELIALSRI